MWGWAVRALRLPRRLAAIAEEQSAEQIRGAWPGPSSSAVRENVATSSAWALLASKVLSEIYVDYAEMYQDSY